MMSNPVTNDCEYLRRETNIDFACCFSCHEDWDDLGREMCHLAVTGRELHVCCNAVTEAGEISHGA